MFFKGKEYYNVAKWVSILNDAYKDHDIKLNKHLVHVLLNHCNVEKQTLKGKDNVVFYSVDDVDNLRTIGDRSRQFLYVMSNLSKYGTVDEPNEVKNTKVTKHPWNNDNKNKEVTTEPSYKNGENDMEKYSDDLINNKYQFEGRKIIRITEDAFNRLFEDVFITNADAKKKKAKIKYDKNTGQKKNFGNEKPGDLLRTDKMDANNDDTYEVPLKGGLMSYNITSISGTDVMHYFKRIFNKEKTYAKLGKYGKEEFELEMEDNEFRSFMQQFITKVSRVVGAKILEYHSKGIDLEGISIYPVPSSSRFNVEMAKRMQFNTLCGFTPKLVDQSLLKKDLSKLQKDDDFINKNKEYYNDKYYKNSDSKATHLNHLNREYERFNAITNSQKNNIEKANMLADDVLQKYYTMNRNTENTKKFYEQLYNMYEEYEKAVEKIASDVNYYDDTTNKYSGAQLKSVAQAIKYSKSASIEKRTNAVVEVLKKHGYLRGIPNYKPTPIQHWAPVDFQIKKLTNDIRMGLKNYFQPNDDKNMVNKEVEETNNTIVVVFDDNISGGATLSDICTQLQNIGVKLIIPITFGRMKEQWNHTTLMVNEPTKWNY